MKRQLFDNKMMFIEQVQSSILNCDIDEFINHQRSSYWNQEEIEREVDPLSIIFLSGDLTIENYYQLLLSVDWSKKYVYHLQYDRDYLGRLLEFTRFHELEETDIQYDQVIRCVNYLVHTLKWSRIERTYEVYEEKHFDFKLNHYLKRNQHIKTFLRLILSIATQQQHERIIKD